MFSLSVFILFFPSSFRWIHHLRFPDVHISFSSWDVSSCERSASFVSDKLERIAPLWFRSAVPEANELWNAYVKQIFVIPRNMFASNRTALWRYSTHSEPHDLIRVNDPFYIPTVFSAYHYWELPRLSCRWETYKSCTSHYARRSLPWDPAVTTRNTGVLSLNMGLYLH